MIGLRKRVAALTTVFGFAALFTALGISLSSAQDKAPDLTDLRDAVKAASKRGDNVDEVAKSLDALDKALAKGWTAPPAGRTVEPPAELVALRDAVEAAAKKGENVEDIRKELEAVEVKLTGKALARPKPLPPIDPPMRPNPRPGFPDFPFPQPIPPFGGGAINPEDIQKAQDLMRKALEMGLRNPNDPKTIQAIKEAQEMMLKAVGGREGLAGLGLPPNLVVPDLGGGLGVGRLPQEKFRLGVRLEKVSELTAEQLGLEAGRGVGITSVVEGSPAEKAGFKPFDVVVEFAGKAVSDLPEDFTRQVNEAEGGKKLSATVIRKGKKVELTGIELLDAGRVLPRPNRDLQVPPLPNIRPGGLNPLPVFPNPFPDLPGKPGLLPNPAGIGRVPPGNGNTAITVSNGEFTMKATQDGVSYVLQGKTENGTNTLTEVTIDDNGKVHKAESLEKVPEEYRATVEKLLKNIQSRARGR